MGTTARTVANGGHINTNSNLIHRTFMTTDDTDGNIIAKIVDWQLVRDGTYAGFRLECIGVGPKNASYWIRTGSNFYSGTCSSDGYQFSFSTTSNDLQIFFGYPYSSSGTFAHIVAFRYSADFYWMGHITTNYNN